jgi:hypothetical protein
VCGLAQLAALKGVGLLVVVLGLPRWRSSPAHRAGCCTAAFKFGWGPGENGWSLFAVGIISALVQGVPAGHMLKPIRHPAPGHVGLVSSGLAYLGFGLATEGWMMYAVIVWQPAGRGGAASIQSLVSNAADASAQGQTMGSWRPQQPDGGGGAGGGAPLLGLGVAPAPPGDWRSALPMSTSAPLQAWAPGAGHPHFRRQAAAAGGRGLSCAMHDKILILDFGSQVTQLIARRVREAHVYCEIHPNDVSDDFVRGFAPKGVILSAATPAPTKSTSCARPQAVWDWACRCWASATACSR